MKYIMHQFRPTETINSVIKLLGRHDYSFEEMQVLLCEFNLINEKRVPHPGDPFKIPILD